MASKTVQNRSKPPGPASTERRIQPELSATTPNAVQKTCRTGWGWLGLGWLGLGWLTRLIMASKTNQNRSKPPGLAPPKRRIQPELNATTQNGVQNRSKPPGPAPTQRRIQPELSATTQNGVQNRSKPFKTFQTRVNWEKDPTRIERYDPKWRTKPVKTIQNRPDPHQLKEGSNPN